VSTETPARARSRWPWLSLLPLGLGSWAPIYAGVRARVAIWTALGTFWSALAVAGWVGATTADHGDHQSSAVAGLLLLLGWAGAAATSFVIRPGYERRMASPLLTASERAEERLLERQRAQQLARQDPRLAREMGVGRPDVAGAADAGLVDVNNAQAAALVKLPGVDDALATRIVEARAQMGGFSSVEDLGSALDLAGDVVEDLRDRVVFLPR
jgi:DNA uptake protein ComE-like DNA-binding protein